jgi:hypothetical protein
VVFFAAISASVLKLPGVEFGLERVDGASFPALDTAHGQRSEMLPPLYGADIPPQVDGDLFPGV